MAITIVPDQMALMRHEIRIGPYSFGADVSADEGGQGLGPNPHDLYDAALGACEALIVAGDVVTSFQMLEDSFQVSKAARA
jgi:putative redox protein